MNKLNIGMQTSIVASLVEGASIRSVERITGVHRDTIMRLGIRVGKTCEELLDEMMVDLPCKKIEVDEIWTFVGKKQRHLTGSDNPASFGDFWVWVAIDPDTKLVPTYAVGKRDAVTAHTFVSDLSSRLANRVQISSDALNLYVDAVEMNFGADVDYAQIVKSYEAEPIGPGRYSPPKVTSVTKTRLAGRPDMLTASTSHVERNNLTMRMGMRRFTRLTNAFSKKPENLKAAVALHFAYYNLARRHGTIKTTPARAAGVTDHIWSLRELVELAN